MWGRGAIAIQIFFGKIFSKNLNSKNVDSDYPRGTCENVVYHLHVTIQIIITSYLRPEMYNIGEHF